MIFLVAEVDFPFLPCMVQFIDWIVCWHYMFLAVDFLNCSVHFMFCILMLLLWCNSLSCAWPSFAIYVASVEKVFVHVLLSFCIPILFGLHVLWPALFHTAVLFLLFLEQLLPSFLLAVRLTFSFGICYWLCWALFPILVAHGFCSHLTALSPNFVSLFVHSFFAASLFLYLHLSVMCCCTTSTAFHGSFRDAFCPVLAFFGIWMIGLAALFMTFLVPFHTSIIFATVTIKQHFLQNDLVVAVPWINTQYLAKH